MNGYPKYVASTSLEEPLEWNNSQLLGDDVAGEVRKLKEEDGKNILMYGSRLFPNGVRKTELELVDATTLENGIVVLDLRRAGA
jgi:hypothetical protein